MFAREVAQSLQELIGRDHVAAFALNGFDDKRGNVVGRRELLEQLILDVPEAFRDVLLGREAGGRAIDIRIRSVVDARHQRSKTAPLHRFAAGQRKRSHRPPMKSALKRDDPLAAGRVPRQLDARFDRFGAGVAEERFHAAANRHNRRQLFGEPHLHVVIEVGA